MTPIQSRFDPVALTELTITERLFQGLRQSPERTVLTDGLTGETRTAAVIEDRIRRLAGGLHAQGQGPGHVIAIMAPNLPDYVTAFHGAAFAGATVTTLNPTYTAEEAHHQLKDSGARLLITVPQFRDTARAAAAGTAVAQIALMTPDDAADAPTLDQLSGDPLPAQVPVDVTAHPAALPYSSGTTGLSKGVHLTHRNLVVNVDQTLAMINLRPGDTTVAFLPFFHIYGLTVLMNLYLAHGATLVTMPRFELERFLALVQTHRPRALWCVPPVAIALAKSPLVDAYDLSSVTHLYSGAAPLGAELTRALTDRLGCQAVQAYGMTEMSPISHITASDRARAGAVGETVPGTECRIVDPETGTDCPRGTEGELWVRGPQVMRGYLNNPEATARTLTPEGWLRTGDLASFDAEGFLFIHDRLKELIKVKGFQVAPAELEAVLLTHPAVDDAAVVGVPDDEAGERPVAHVVLKPGTTATEAALQAHILDHLSPYKALAAVRFAESIPKSASGKILRRLLRAAA